MSCSEYDKKKYAPKTYVENDGDTETVFAISEENLPIFDRIFKSLEDNMANLRISIFGCSFTILQDVFLKLADDNIKKVTREIIEKSQKFQKVGVPIFFQIYAMLYKKFHIFRKNWKLF